MKVNCDDFDAKNDEKFDLDLVLLQLGQFGKYQFKNYIFIVIIVIFNAMFTLSYVFTAGNLNYRCQVTECETETAAYEADEKFLQNAVPFVNGAPARCQRFALDKNFTANITSGEKNCDFQQFDQKNVIECDKFIYENDEKTIVNEFNLNCPKNEWKLTLVGTVNNIGQFVCLPITGYISDKFGRRVILVMGTVLGGLAGVIRSLSTSYEMFVIMEFIDPLISSGIYSAGFILGMELVGHKMRVIGGSVIQSFYAVGEVLMGIVAMYFHNWRTFLQILYAPALLCISYFWLLPESVRWLLAKGRNSKAEAILRTAASVNGKKLPDSVFDSLYNDNRLLAEKGETEEESYPITEVFKNRTLLIRITNCAFCWLTNTLVYYGLSLNSVNIAGNKYTNFILISLIEIPAYFVVFLLLNKIGRRTALCGALLISGIACMLSEFVPQDKSELRLAMFLLGKLAITISFTVLYVYTTELFPTTIRHSLLGTCSMFGRIGSMIAPQTPLLARILPSLPLLLFGGTAIASGLLVLQFPETANTKLPDTIEEALDIDKHKSDANK